MEEILHQLRLVVYPIIYRVSYIPGGAGFQPSTVCQVFWKTTNIHSHFAKICRLIYATFTILGRAKETDTTKKISKNDLWFFGSNL